MTIRVNIDGVGTATFPDGTNDDVIQKSVNDLIAEKKTNLKERYSGPLGQFKKIWDIANQEAQSGEALMQKATEEPTGGNLIKGLLGAVQWAASPLTAAARGTFRDPAEIISRSLGAPKGVTKFVGDMAEQIDIVLPYGALIKSALATKKMTDAITAAERATRSMEAIASQTTKTKLKFPKGTTEETIQKVQERVGPRKNVLAEEATNNLVDAVKEKVGPMWNPQEKRITQEVADYFTKNPEEIQSFLKKYPEYTPERLGAEIIETMSTSGRELAIMGKFARELKKKFQSPDMQKIANFLEKEIPEMTTMDKVMSGAKQIENVRRSLLVGQLATTARNIISQGGRLTIGAIDDAFEGAVKGFMQSADESLPKSIISGFRGLGEGLDAVTAAINRFRPSERKALLNILDQDAALKAKAALGTSVHEVTTGSKLAGVINTLNYAQERFFRAIAFEAKLNHILKSSGIPNGLKGIDPKNIPEKAFMEASNYALEMTFAAMPKSTFGKDFVKAMSNPVFTALLNPFPRFLYGNALPFLKQFSPIGFLDALSPSVVAELASGNADKFAKAASRATIGTLMLGGANYLRNSEYAGEKWYEIKIGNRLFDTRAFAPLTTYLFIAEAMKNPDSIKPADIGSAMLSLNRIAGTGLVLSDILRGKDAQTTINVLKRLGGEYLGSFTTPARTVKDLYTTIDPEEAVMRDIRDNEGLGPTIRNIPRLSQTLPEAVSPLITKRLKTESPVLRQLTGISYRTKEAIESELDSIHFNKTMAYSKTGIPKADNEISRIMSPMVDQISNTMLNAPGYKKLDDQTKRVIWWALFNEIKSEARNQYTKENPEMATRIKIEALPSPIIDLLKSRGINLEQMIKNVQQNRGK